MLDEEVSFDEEITKSNDRSSIQGMRRRVVVDLALVSNIFILINTGLELNLITPKAAANNNLHLFPLPRPTKVNLVQLNGSADPLFLTHGATILLEDPHSEITFQGVQLKVGSMSGEHDLILGTPLLVSVQSLHFYCQSLYSL
ncbi:uncharacterized protein VP01_6324g2 [Puccinia sorghi]|uniref:Uncharacterized protein n=1 Tax=Puccinia sorghi TaxID=27349 RepID=A0A0L6UIB4_9BASI|nr:uncharacterized protein VP01_6324g2 [Puccinia sorghi]